MKRLSLFVFVLLCIGFCFALTGSQITIAPVQEVGINIPRLPAILPNCTTQVRDFYISNITPEFLIVDEENKVRCYFQKDGPIATGSIDVNLKITNEDNDVVARLTKNLLASNYNDFNCGAEYYVEFILDDSIIDSAEEYILECSLLNTGDVNTNNNIATLAVDASYDFDLATSIDTDDDEYMLKENFDIVCDYENEADRSITFRDSDTEVLLKVYADNDLIDNCEWDITSQVEDNRNGTKKCAYEIPSNYRDDEIDLECRIDYNPEGSDRTRFIDSDEDNDKDKITVDVIDDIANDGAPSGTSDDTDNVNTNTGSGINPGIDLALVSLDVSTPVLKDRLSAITCVVQNGGSLTATNGFYISWFLDGQEMYKSKMKTNILPSYGTYTFIYNHVFLKTGIHKVRCEVTYNNTELTLRNNYAEKNYTVELESNTNTNGNAAGNLNDSDTVSGINEGNNYILKVKGLIANSYKNGYADLTCIYANEGTGELQDYQIIITHKDKVVKTQAFAEIIAPKQSKSYNTKVNIGLSGGLVGCIIRPLDSTRGAAQYTNLTPQSSIFAVFIVVGVLVIIGLIIYLVVRTD